MFILLALPRFVEGQYRNGFILSEGEDFALRLNGRVQARYEYFSPEAGEDLSSFYLRRVRLDFRGHIFDSRFSFRIMPDLARAATLRDGWIHYAFSPAANITAGQMVVPFHRQRSVSGMRQHFTERSIPSETFGMPSGYDIGVMFHGSRPDMRLRYAAGVYDGVGRNTKQSNSNGNLASARIMGAALGRIATDETDRAISETPNVTLGLGAMGATKNEVRNWALGRAADNRADFISATADIHLAWQGFSGAFDYYFRHVSPEATGGYTGDGFLVTGGYLIGGRYEPVVRYSRLILDRRDDNTENRQTGGGLNIYHRGHNLKTRINYFREDNAGLIDNTFLVESHLSF